MCPVCGDDGMVTGWKGLIWDMTNLSVKFPH
jgi:RNA polymerase subunit RPABC4/transcription elongation factor Spt4